MDRYTVLTVIGPAQLVVETVAPQSSLRLESGLLVGEYEHHPGGTLRVHSPGATTTVVGTLFAVQAVGADQSRVAVRRGAVVVEGRGQSVRLRAGWSWSSGEVARPEIPAALAEQLAAHAAHREPARDPALPGSRAHPLASPLVQAGAVLLDPSASPTAERSPTAEPHAPGAASSETDAEKDPAKNTDKGAVAVEAPRPKAEAAAATADSLYAEAEAAMRAGDRAAVRSRLTEVIRRFPRDGLADAAFNTQSCGTRA
ncbi:MAG TPA: FecR domain-containing protein, partial [Pseudomonadota bacterium]|nr:FecR domain-containing protein [Pseudomonadota bacterium]